MIVTDNFLSKAHFSLLQQYCRVNEFEIVTLGEKQFLVLETPPYLIPLFQIEGYELICTFIRSAKNDFDTDQRIHADNIINGHKTALASVLYLNEKDEVSKNGTMFWIHETHGDQLDKSVSNEEFDRLITQDSNDLSKWEASDIVHAKPNRRLLYNSNSFHSKWPAKIEKGERKVLVCFYAEKTKI